jgi:aminoglycoside phosphotransferase (APT) family kinase protein
MAQPDLLPANSWAAALDSVLDARVMSHRLAPENGNDGDFRVTSIRVVASSPDKRAVLAYTTNAPRGAGRDLIGKVYADPARAGREHHLLRQLRDLCASGIDCAVPRPTALLADLGMSVHERATGRSLDRIHGRARHQGVVSAAHWLSGLHSARLDLDRHLDLGAETRKLTRWGDLVGRAHPEAERTSARLVERLLRLADGLEPSAPVCIHKDFHYQHLLVANGSVVVIDLDEMRLGDPAFDVAHFIAYLRLLALRETGTCAGLSQLASTFLGEYAARTGFEVNSRYDFFLGYTRLKIANQLARRRGPSPAPAGAELVRQLDLILAEG